MMKLRRDKRIERCETCAFQEKGDCHRYPPQVLVLPEKSKGSIGPSAKTVFPEVDDRDWCGEYKPDEGEPE